jgi:hypothetical protein
MQRIRRRTVVAVLTSPDLLLSVGPLEDRLGHAGVMQEPQRVVARIREAIEPALANAHAQRNRTHNLDVQALARLEELQHVLLEHLGVVVPAGPHVGRLGLVVAPDFQTLFQVRHSLAQLGLGARLLEHDELLAALRDVSAVCYGRVPRHSILLLLRPVEEFGAVGKGIGYGWGRNAVVLEVDEAGVLEALEDGFGGRLFCGGITREKGCKVDKLWGLASSGADWRWRVTGITRSSWATASLTVMCDIVLQAG